MSPGFVMLESFGHDELTAKHCYCMCSRPPDVEVIKIFDKDDQATKPEPYLALNIFQSRRCVIKRWCLEKLS